MYDKKMSLSLELNKYLIVRFTCVFLYEVFLSIFYLCISNIFRGNYCALQSFVEPITPASIISYYFVLFRMLVFHKSITFPGVTIQETPVQVIKSPKSKLSQKKSQESSDEDEEKDDDMDPSCVLKFLVIAEHTGGSVSVDHFFV